MLQGSATESLIARVLTRVPGLAPVVCAGDSLSAHGRNQAPPSGESEMPSFKHVLVIAVVALAVIYVDQKVGITAKLP